MPATPCFLLRNICSLGLLAFSLSNMILKIDNFVRTIFRLLRRTL